MILFDIELLYLKVFLLIQASNRLTPWVRIYIITHNYGECTHYFSILKLGWNTSIDSMCVLHWIHAQGCNQDFLKGHSKNSIELPEQGSGGTAPSRWENLNILIVENLIGCYTFNTIIAYKVYIYPWDKASYKYRYIDNYSFFLYVKVRNRYP